MSELIFVNFIIYQKNQFHKKKESIVNKSIYT